jgi:aminopeptidase
VLDADPVAAWRFHVADLSRRAAHLTHKKYATLRYTAPGTRLTVGLPQGHVWLGGEVISQTGIPFVPNLPTEEVFTLPDRAQVDGTVAATKPFVTSGNIIEGMVLTFSEGKVVQASAWKGEAFLHGLLRTDEGTARLGEVALVPHTSPVSQMGVTFHNILFDENASSHIALGAAHRSTLQGGATATDDQFLSAGGNLSSLHEDFMVGSAALDVDRVRGDGKSEPVMRAGEWAFDT